MFEIIKTGDHSLSDVVLDDCEMECMIPPVDRPISHTDLTAPDPVMRYAVLSRLCSTRRAGFPRSRFRRNQLGLLPLGFRALSSSCYGLAGSFHGSHFRRQSLCA